MTAFNRFGRKHTHPHTRDAEQQSLRTVIESNPDGMVVIDHDGTILFAKPAAERLSDQVAPHLVGSHFGVPHAPDGEVEIELIAGGAPRAATMRAVALDWEGTFAFLASLRT